MSDLKKEWEKLGLFTPLDAAFLFCEIEPFDRTIDKHCPKIVDATRRELLNWKNPDIDKSRSVYEESFIRRHGTVVRNMPGEKLYTVETLVKFALETNRKPSFLSDHIAKILAEKHEGISDEPQTESTRSRRDIQKDEIKSMCLKLGFELKELPNDAKKRVKKKLLDEKIFTDSSFDTTWKKLINKEIHYGKGSPYIKSKGQ